MKRGLISGKPRPIRSDEWMVNATMILAQHQRGYPDSNDLVGYGKSPLLMGLPTMNVISMVKPALWGYYFLDIERAFSWHWNFKIFPFLIATFLFLMLLTKNHFWLSLVGSIWLLLSSAVQWWSMYNELFTYGFVALISFVYLLFSKKTGLIFLNGILFSIAAYCFAMVLYPAYLVPLAYFLLAVLIGFMVQHRKFITEAFRSHWKIRLPALLISIFLLGGLLVLFFNEASDTIRVLSNTIYPGKRFETGGDVPFLRLFTDLFSWFVNDMKYPAAWLNISELSTYLMLSLLPCILIVYDFIRTRKTNPLLLSLVVFQVIVLVWLFIGFPEIIAGVSLFSTSPATRTLYIYGAVNVITTILFLAHFKKSLLPKPPVYKIASLVILLLVSFMITHMLNKQTSDFFALSQVLLGAGVFGALNWLVLHFNNSKYYQYGFYLLILVWVIPNLRVNPLCKGLTPFFENQFYKTVSEIKKTDPEAGWAVFGQSSTADFLKTTGVKILNGVKFAPPLDKLAVIDREMRYDSIHNRYAHVGMKSLINTLDSLRFDLKQKDLYTIWMDPCSPRLTELGIKYIMFSVDPYPIELRCMTPVNVGLRIYRRNDL